MHTVSPELGLALSNFDGDIRYQTWELGRALSTDLHLHLSQFIQPQTWADLAFLVVAKGPGGFTGTRIGVVTARTLAQQLEIPLFAISTLAAHAWSMCSPPISSGKSLLGTTHLAVQMPAQRGELFTAIYSIETEPNLKLAVQLPDTVMVQEAWEQVLQSWGSPYRLLTVEGGLGSSASSLLELADLDWQQGIRPSWSLALPFYGQLGAM